MSVFAHHPLRHTGTRSHSARQFVHALLSGFVRRIADSPLEQPVLHALKAPASRSVAGAARRRPHAHWRVAYGPDGGRYLEATWHTRH
ncbi:hypothetical protein AV521_31975 [Streptomyces sp. IMTB 2501]|uniref:hypothetical protein n=1 Tax=Streptomyces sp. IMTB 2501 TaxID=1776340 RepID=UPI0009700D34|nr:hypothetical protein [Streptomyces sp. IMTB 2501]OLZ65314.1 hypothetical protein AV521_31975 [Streptomyces sp. IMTB 2501]